MPRGRIGADYGPLDGRCAYIILTVVATIGLVVTPVEKVLALCIAQVSSPPVFAFLSNWIGVLGAFMTSSTTASNILFTPLQHQVAQATQQLSQATMVASHNAGGAVGNVIAPANVVLGTGPAGILGEEGVVLRKALTWTITLAILTGGATMLLNATA